MLSEIKRLKKELKKPGLSHRKLEKIGGDIGDLYKKAKNTKFLIAVLGLIALFLSVAYKLDSDPPKSEPVVASLPKEDLPKPFVSKFSEPINEKNIVIPEPDGKVGTALLQVAGYLDMNGIIIKDGIKPFSDVKIYTKLDEVESVPTYYLKNFTGFEYELNKDDLKNPVTYKSEAYEEFKADVLEKNADFIGKLKRIKTDFNYDFQTKETGEFVFLTGIPDYDDITSKIAKFIEKLKLENVFPRKLKSAAMNTKDTTKITIIHDTEIKVDINVQSGNDRGNVPSSSVFRVKIGKEENNEKFILKIFPAAHPENPNAHFTNSAEFIYQCLLNERNIEYRFYGGGKLMIENQLCTFLVMKNIGMDKIDLTTFAIKPLSLLADISLSHALLQSAGWLHGDAHSGNVFLTPKSGLLIDFGNMFTVEKAIKAMKDAKSVADPNVKKAIEMIVFMNILDPLSSGIFTYITTFNEKLKYIEKANYENYGNNLKNILEKLTNARYIYNHIDKYTPKYVDEIATDLIYAFNEVYDILYTEIIKKIVPETKKENKVLPKLLDLYKQYLNEFLKSWNNGNSESEFKLDPELYMKYTYDLCALYNGFGKSDDLKNTIYNFEKIMQDEIEKVKQIYLSDPTKQKEYIDFITEKIKKLEEPITDEKGKPVTIKYDGKEFLLKFEPDYQNKFSTSTLQFYEKLFYNKYVFEQDDILNEFKEKFTYDNFERLTYNDHIFKTGTTGDYWEYFFKLTEEKRKEIFEKIKKSINNKPKYMSIQTGNNNFDDAFFEFVTDEKMNDEAEKHRYISRAYSRLLNIIISMINMENTIYDKNILNKYKTIYKENIEKQIPKEIKESKNWYNIITESEYEKLQYELIRPYYTSNFGNKNLWNEFIKTKISDEDVFDRVMEKYEMRKPFEIVAGFGISDYYFIILVVIILILVLLLVIFDIKLPFLSRKF